MLGHAFEAGIALIPTTAAVGAPWYRLAFEGGRQRALLHLGQLYELRRDFAKCEEVYGAGAVDHWGPAINRLAWIKLQQPKTPARLIDARDLLEQAGTAG